MYLHYNTDNSNRKAVMGTCCPDVCCQIYRYVFFCQVKECVPKYRYVHMYVLYTVLELTRNTRLF